MRLGIIGPTLKEITPLIDELNLSTPLTYANQDFYETEHKGIELILVCGGVCKVNAAMTTQILIDKFSATHIVVTGVAGGMEKSLKIMDTVISDKMAYHDVDNNLLSGFKPWSDLKFFEADRGLLAKAKQILDNSQYKDTVKYGTIVTGENFIAEEGRKEIIKNYNPLCVDMETASVAHVCHFNKIPFLAIRTLSDTEEESGFDVFERYCGSAAVKSIAVLKLIFGL